MDIQAFLAKLKKRHERIGIDVCGHATRVVRLSKLGEEAFTLVGSGTIDVNAYTATPLEMERLRALVGQVGGRAKHAALSIEHPSLRIRCMRLADMPARDLLEAVRWNFRDHIDIPLEQFTVGYTSIGALGSDKEKLILAYGVSHEAIEQHIAIGKSMGCKPISIEPVATALLSAFDVNLTWEKHKYVAALLIDDCRATFTVMANGILLFSRLLEGVCDDDLEKIVATSLRVQPATAREVVTKWSASGPEGIPQEDLDDERREVLTAVIGQFYSQLVLEAQRTIDAFCILYEVDHIDSLYVCGTGARYPGLVQHLETTLGVKTQAFNPFERVVVPDDFRDNIDAWASTYAVAVGLSVP